MYICFFFFNDTATTEIYTLSLHDALPIWAAQEVLQLRVQEGSSLQDRHAASSPRDEITRRKPWQQRVDAWRERSEEHTSELQSRQYLVCRLLLEKKKTRTNKCPPMTTNEP